MKKSTLLQGLLAGVVIASALGAYALLTGDEPQVSRKASANPVMGSPTDWRQMTTLLSTRAQSDLEREQLLEELGPAQTIQAQYLRALLYLSKGYVFEAASTFEGLDPEQLPEEMLYAPARVLRETRSPRAAAFEKRMLKVRNQLPRIQQARVAASQGRLSEALAIYQGTDPAQWARIDQQYLGNLTMHSGLFLDARRLVLAALNADRLPEALKPGLITLLDGQKDAEQQAVQRLRECGNCQEQLAAAVRQAADARKAFVERRFGQLVNGFKDRDVVAASNESVLMLVVASAAEANGLEFDRWSQELMRRSPEQETATWVNNLWERSEI